MKPMILVAFCALSLHATASDAVAPVADHPAEMAFEAPEAPDGYKAPAIPEAGALVLGLFGAMMLLRRRR